MAIGMDLFFKATFEDMAMMSYLVNKTSLGTHKLKEEVKNLDVNFS